MSISTSQIELLKKVARDCNALYICPKVDGKRTGPLVAYAGKDSQGKNLVGDIYFNFRRIERKPLAVEQYALAVCRAIHNSHLQTNFDTVCGIPNGGRTLGQEIARLLEKQFVYADKKPKPTEPGKKQEYEWDLSQFDFTPGERLAVVEDVFNNFQNTDNTLVQVAATGAEVTILLGALNRSPFVNDSYTPKSGRSIPVVCAIREAYPEFKQDDPEVAADIAAGKLELEVKKNWAHLMSLS